MRELVPMSYCSVDWVDSEERVPASFSATLALNGKSYEVDVCDEHREIDLNDLEEFLARYGYPVRKRRTVKATKPAPVAPAVKPAKSTRKMKFKCPHCPRDDFQSDSGRKRHITRQHPEFAEK